MVVRAANGLENSRSTLMTGMPASIACVATSVSAAPSVGSSTIASTLSLMKLSTWLICRFASFVPSATFRSMSGYFFASASAAELMAPSQPWSAAGPEKPIVIFSPVAWLPSDVACDGSVVAVVSPVVSVVHPVMRPATAIVPTAAKTMRRRMVLCLSIRSPWSWWWVSASGGADTATEGARRGDVGADAVTIAVPPARTPGDFPRGVRGNGRRLAIRPAGPRTPSPMLCLVIEGDHAASLLDVRGITKAFAGVQALKGVDISVRPGEVHCVLGQNGAGKSTLIKVLSGVHQPDAGELVWNGQPVTIADPVAALTLGSATMYQELDVVEGLPIAENIFLGHETSAAGMLRVGESNRLTRELLGRLGHGGLSPSTE